MEAELLQLEKNEIPSTFSDELDCHNHLKEVDLLRSEMYKILGSEAFESLEGKSKIHEMLNEGSQQSIQTALNQLLESKIAHYSSANSDDHDGLKLGEFI